MFDLTVIEKEGCPMERCCRNSSSGRNLEFVGARRVVDDRVAIEDLPLDECPAGRGTRPRLELAVVPAIRRRKLHADDDLELLTDAVERLRKRHQIRGGNDRWIG